MTVRTCIQHPNHTIQSFCSSVMTQRSWVERIGLWAYVVGLGGLAWGPARHLHAIETLCQREWPGHRWLAEDGRGKG